MSQRPHLDQIQAFIATYRNLNEKDTAAKAALAKDIEASSLPSYHKEAMTVGLLTTGDGETILALSILRQQEQLRHTEALLNIERKVLEERIKKRQRA